MGCIVLIVVGDAGAYFGASSRYFGKNSNSKDCETFKAAKLVYNGDTIEE
jgi:hypothetical protein